jgi:hypothetical protein
MKTSTISGLSQRCISFLGSHRCFVLILVVFVLEAAWIALSGRYPMAFDEDFHLGLIRLYSDHLSPFLAAQPASADVFGAVSRDPSYLYHYLMSFPYRLISLLTDNQTLQVLFFRAINISLFTAALPLYRQLLLKTSASTALVNSCLAVFVLIPIVPLLAAQINYDNLLLPLTALALLLTVTISEELQRSRQLNLKKSLYLLAVLLSTCLVKYAFLPMALVIGAYLLIRLKQTYPHWRQFQLSLGRGYRVMTGRSRWLLLIILVLASGLFVQRYGVNLVHYQRPVADCSQVLGEQRCLSYAPWARDHRLAAIKDPAAVTTNPLVFTADWFYGMWLRTFFAVDGPATNFQTRGPFVIPAFGAIVFTLSGTVAFLVYHKRIFNRYNSRVLWLFIAVSAGYVAVLWLDGYQSFVQAGQTVALNGRYLLPVMPLFLLLCAIGLNESLHHRRQLKLAVATTGLICMLWGGGALTYILRSNDAWYWHSQPVYSSNHAVQHVLGPITPGYHDPTAFMGRN